MTLQHFCHERGEGIFGPLLPLAKLPDETTAPLDSPDRPFDRQTKLATSSRYQVLVYQSVGAQAVNGKIDECAHLG